MKRRSFLRQLSHLWVGSVGLGVGLCVRASTASALGGVLPTLDEPAPPFRLHGVIPPSGGKGEPVPAELALEDFRQRWLVLYFYPQDFTPGCTLEARGFQRDLESFHQRDADVVGISSDTLDSHGSFCGSEGLAYPLLSDPKGEVCRRYGSWLAPSALRHTFLIDPQGILRARWVDVRPLHHSQEVLATLASLRDA